MGVITFTPMGHIGSHRMTLVRIRLTIYIRIMHYIAIHTVGRGNARQGVPGVRYARDLHREWQQAEHGAPPSSPSQ